MATLRRLTCDASLVRITENQDGEPLDVGRKTRTIPPAIRRALNARDPGCCFPGCTSTRWLDAHHVEHWADGGWRFRRPDGREFEVLRGEPAHTHHWSTLCESNAAHGIVIDSTTAATRWTGERLDYHLAIPILCAQAGIKAPLYGPYDPAEGARDVSAGTSNDASDDDDPHHTRAPGYGGEGSRYWNGTAWIEYDDDDADD